MKRFVIALAAALSVASLSAFAGRDQSDIMLQQQTIKRLQEERAKAAAATAEMQQKLEDCKKLQSSKQP
jgi:outer membrane lipoprotein-sorting protein